MIRHFFPSCPPWSAEKASCTSGLSGKLQPLLLPENGGTKKCRMYCIRARGHIPTEIKANRGRYCFHSDFVLSELSRTSDDESQWNSVNYFSRLNMQMSRLVSTRIYFLMTFNKDSINQNLKQWTCLFQTFLVAWGRRLIPWILIGRRAMTQTLATVQSDSTKECCKFQKKNIKFVFSFQSLVIGFGPIAHRHRPLPSGRNMSLSCRNQ